MSKHERKVRPKIGLLYAGLEAYWSQFPDFVEIGTNMLKKYMERFELLGDVVLQKFIDTPEGSTAAGKVFADEKIDILFVLPFGYTTGMVMLPAINAVTCPVRFLVTHEDATYDYKTAQDKDWLHHSGICCVPEIAGTLVRMGRKFRVITGWLEDPRFWDEIERDAAGAATAREFKTLNFAAFGNPYTNMTDMPADDHRLLKATGKMFLRPEIEEFAVEYDKVTEPEVKDMLAQFRDMYEMDDSVTDEHMYESAKIAVVYDKIIAQKYDISGYGYYWWGQSDPYTHLRAQSAIAGSRLASMGRPGVTEGDAKTAMGMKIFDLLGAGGMFLEFNTIDYVDDFILISHDGPVNFNVSEGKPQLKHLAIHHGKTGHGLGIDFDLKKGPATVLNFTQFDNTVDTFKLIYTVGEVVPGDMLHCGNPNARFKLGSISIPDFVDAWCQEGAVHHSSLGIGDMSREIEIFAEVMGFKCVRVG
jgi:L-arabinose isomerase